MLSYSDIASLFKIRITLSVGFIASIGWYVAQRGFGNIEDFLIMLTATLMVCAGVCALNHVEEWQSDAVMKRTQKRPIPSGRVGVIPALLLSAGLLAAGLAIMWISISFGMAFGAFLTGVIYILIYTPLKKVSWINTSVGAIPGALPVMGGWYAAQGKLGLEGWVLFMIMFFWQHPHFYAIAWLCREDYQKAGYRMLVKNDKEGKTTFAHALFHTFLLSLAALGLIFTEFKAGWVYVLSVSVINLFFLIKVVGTYRCLTERKKQAAQGVLSFSVWYQICFFIFVIFDNLFRVKIL